MFLDSHLKARHCQGCISKNAVRGRGGLDPEGENQMILFSSQPPGRQGLPGAKSRGFGVGKGNATESGSQGQPEDPRIGAWRQEGKDSFLYGRAIVLTFYCESFQTYANHLLSTHSSRCIIIETQALRNSKYSWDI